MSAKDWLTEQVEQAHDCDLNLLSALTTSEIKRYIINEHLRRIRIDDETTENEAEELITKLKCRVIPLISHFCQVDEEIQRRISP